MTDLNQRSELRVTDACHKPWGELVKQEDATRFCGDCELHVHNSTSMTQLEAQNLVQESEGRVCMRLVQDDAGKTLYSDTLGTVSATAAVEQVPSIRENLTRWALVAGAGLLTACQGELVETRIDQTPPDGEQPEVGHTGTGNPDDPENWQGLLGEVGYIEVMGDVIVVDPDPIQPVDSCGPLPEGEGSPGRTEEMTDGDGAQPDLDVTGLEDLMPSEQGKVMMGRVRATPIDIPLDLTPKEQQ